MSDGSEKLYQALPLGLYMHVCTYAQLCVCACVCTRAYACVCMHLGISFANLTKLIMGPIFSLRCFPDLIDKNSALPDLAKVFQTRKANIPGHTQMQNVTHLDQLEIEMSIGLEGSRIKDQGSRIIFTDSCSAKSFRGL